MKREGSSVRMIEPAHAQLRCYKAFSKNRRNTLLTEQHVQFRHMQPDYSQLQLRPSCKENKRMTVLQDIKPGEVSVNYDELKKKELLDKHYNLKSSGNLFECHPSISKTWGFCKKQLKDRNTPGDFKMEPNYENIVSSPEPRECLWSEEDCHKWRTAREEKLDGKLEEGQFDLLSVIECDWGTYSFKQNLKCELKSSLDSGNKTKTLQPTSSCQESVVVLECLPALQNVLNIEIVTNKKLKLYYKERCKYVYLNSPALLKRKYLKTCH
nr:uncharacterized protein LOC123757247 [Procambarus clarkii]